MGVASLDRLILAARLHGQAQRDVESAEIVAASRPMLALNGKIRCAWDEALVAFREREQFLGRAVEAARTECLSAGESDGP